MPNSSLDSRLASRENEVFSLEKKKKKKNIAWSRKGLKTRQWIFCFHHEQVCVHGWKEESSKSFLDRRLKLADPSRSGGNAKRFSPGNRRIAEEEEEEEDGVRVHH